MAPVGRGGQVAAPPQMRGPMMGGPPPGMMQGMPPPMGRGAMPNMRPPGVMRPPPGPAGAGQRNNFEF